MSDQKLVFSIFKPGRYLFAAASVSGPNKKTGFIYTYLVGILVHTVTPKTHFEINRPLGCELV